MNLEYGEVRIGASDMSLQFYLLPYLERFHQLYPEIKVTVTNAPTPQTIDHLNQGRIDFGVVTKPLDIDSKYDSYLEERKVSVTPEFELATSDMIVQFAMRNLGIGCVVEDFAKKQIDSGELFRLEFKKKIPERDMCLMIDQRSTMSVAAAKLLELLKVTNQDDQ